jgi:hypothetical protein
MLLLEMCIERERINRMSYDYTFSSLFIQRHAWSQESVLVFLSVYKNLNVLRIRFDCIYRFGFRLVGQIACEVSTRATIV